MTPGATNDVPEKRMQCICVHTLVHTQWWRKVLKSKTNFWKQCIIKEQWNNYGTKFIPIKLYTHQLCITQIWLSFMNVVKSYLRWKITKNLTPSTHTYLGLRWRNLLKSDWVHISSIHVLLHVLHQVENLKEKGQQNLKTKGAFDVP